MSDSKEINAPSSKEVETFVYAARDNKTDIISAFLENYPGYADAEDHGRRTAMMYAARFGHTETIELLLQYGADPNHAGHGGFTPVILASAAGFSDAVVMLADCGARLDAISDKAKTAFQLATRNGHQDVVDFIAARLPRQKRFGS